MDRIVDGIATIDLNYQKITFPVIGVLVLFCIVGIFKIPVESNPVGYFKEDTEVSRNFHDIYQHLSGSFPINVTMGSDVEEYFQTVENIVKIDKMQKYIDTLAGIDKTISFADYLKLVNYASNQFNPEYYRLPEEAWELRMLINSYKMMLGEDMLNRFMTPDFSQANILLLTHISSSTGVSQGKETDPSACGKYVFQGRPLECHRLRDGDFGEQSPDYQRAGQKFVHYHGHRLRHHVSALFIEQGRTDCH